MRMREQQRRWSARSTWLRIIIIASLIILCIFFIFLILKILGLNTGLAIASIFYDIFTTIFVIATFWYQWPAVRRLQQAQQLANTSSGQLPRGILGVPPSTDLKNIQQCEKVVKDVYARLIQPDATAVLLTGIVGCGKSHVAALICSNAEKQREVNAGPFTGKPLWLEIDENVIISDIAVTLFEELGNHIADFDNLSLQNQATALFNALNQADQTRLIVLDQFDRLLDPQTGHIRADHSGVGEWLDAIISQPCKCRIILTSRYRPYGPRGYNPAGMNEYCIEGLDDAEAKQLLLSRGGNKVARPQPSELDKALTWCNNHPLALALLASRLNDHSLGLSTFFIDPAHIKRWREEIASYGPDGGLDTIYMTQLTPEQQKLLLAFSIFRKPVPRDAAQALISFTVPMSRVQSVAGVLVKFPIPRSRVLYNCEVLLRHHLIQASRDDEDCYQLHPIVAAYAQDHFDKSDEEANEDMLQRAHAEAAQYYLQKPESSTTGVDQHSARVFPQLQLIEAIWHQCQAGQWQKAYDLLEQEKKFSSLRSQSEDTVLLELYLQLVASNKWHPKDLEKLRIYNNLGEICKALGKKQEALRYYSEVLAISRALQDSNREQTTLEVISELRNATGEIN